jgi:hypothetical protein
LHAILDIDGIINMFLRKMKQQGALYSKPAMQPNSAAHKIDQPLKLRRFLLRYITAFLFYQY